MKRNIVRLLIIGLIPLSITSVFGQTKASPTEKDAQTAQVIAKDFFNYESLDVIFETFKKKYGFKINYKKEDAAKYNLTYSFFQTPPKLAIEICLRETPLGFVMDDTGVFYIYDRKQKAAEEKAAEQTRYSGTSTRQNFTLSGIVKDKITGEPLPFVNLKLSRTTKGTATNVDGYFSLLKVPNDTTTLDISYIGYKNRTIFLTPKTPLSNFLIELEPQAAVLDEFTVAADREELLRAGEKISMLKLTPAKIAALPSVGEKDIMRAFQLMPGVSAANENSSGLYVRGGTPDQTLVLYDGFNVYHVEHLFGFFSAFNPNAIKDVQLYKGGFESKFGGRIGSVAEITGKEGNSKGINVGVDAGFLAANAFVEIPMGNKITSMFAFRRSYQTSLYDKIFKKYNGATQVASVQQGGRGGFGNRFNTTVASYFYDLNAKFTYKPTTKDILTLSLYNGTDNMDNSRKTPAQFAGRGFNFDVSDLTYWGNLGGSFKWSRRINDRFYVNTLVSYSNYYSQRDRSTLGRISLNQIQVGSNVAPINTTTSPPFWFQFVSNGTDATCTSLNACPNGNPAGRVAGGGTQPTDESFYTSAISEARIQTPNAEEVKWTAQRNAYGRLMDNPSEQNNREKSNFIGRMRNTSMGQLYQVEKGVKDAQNIGQEYGDVLMQNANSIKTLANEIADLDAKIFVAKGAEKTALIAQKKEKNAIIHRLSTENAPRHATIERKRNQEVQRLMRDNERISTRLQPEINEKEVNAIYLATVAQGKLELNSEQKATVRLIAYQCPSFGGNAVFAARSLYSLVENVNFDDLALCNARSESVQGLKTKKVETFKVSPIPATDVLTVSQSSEQVETGEWLIYDMAGKLLLTKKVSENEMQANINIQSLFEGIYFVSFVVNGEKRFNQKFIKIKSN